MFAIGVLELVVALGVALAAMGCYLMRLRGTRWVAAAAGCLALASVLTPADLASTLIIAAVCLACFYGGMRQRQSTCAPTN